VKSKSLSLNVTVLILYPNVSQIGKSIRCGFRNSKAAPLQTSQLWLRKACLHVFAAPVSVGLMGLTKAF